MKKALLIIAQKGYQDVELNGTCDGVLAAGFSVVLCSKETGECIGKYDGREMSQVAMRDVNVADYDRVAFIGGPGAFALAGDPEALALAQAVFHGKKPLGAICIAPTILAAAGVLMGKKATVATPSEEQVPFLESKGATYTGQPVTVDGLIVTANGPAAAVEFGKVFAAM